MVRSNTLTQNSIENKLQNPLAVALNNEDPFKQIFGNAKEWIFEEGIFCFMLNPVNRRWLFWDRFHDEWKDTGHYAGEVKFVWDGKRLLTPALRPSTFSLAYEAGAKITRVEGSTQEYPVFANTLFGNERNSDIRIEDNKSKGWIFQHAGGYTFFAIGKKDEILVNDDAVPPKGVLLHDGDRIRIGKTQFDFLQISQTDSKSTEQTQSHSESNPTQKSPGHSIGAECHNCNAELEDHVKFCTSCGAKVIDKPVKPTCPGCAGEISESLKFCTNCGQKL